MAKVPKTKFYIVLSTLDTPEKYFRKFKGIVGKLFETCLQASKVSNPEYITFNQWEDGSLTPTKIPERGSKVLLVGIEATTWWYEESGEYIKTDPSIYQLRGIPVWNPFLDSYGIPTLDPEDRLITGDHVKKNGPEVIFFKDFVEDIIKFSELPSEKITIPEPVLLVPRTTQEAVFALREYRERLKKDPDPVLACDLETASLSPQTMRIIDAGISIDDDSALILTEGLLEVDIVQRELELLLNMPGIDSGNHNACQFDAEFILTTLGFEWNVTWDSMFAHYLLDERQAGHGLKELLQRNLFYHDYDVKLNYKAGETMESIPAEVRHIYLGHDCIGARKLWKYLKPLLEEEGDLMKVFREILIPAGNAFRDIGVEGVLVDVEYLKEKSKSSHIKEADTLRQLQEIASEVGMEDLNPNSPAQVKKLLYDYLGLKPKKSSDGKLSTDAETLLYLKKQYPDNKVLQLILDYRLESKLRGTFLDGLINKVSEYSGKVHADFQLTGTQTGRLSCRNPNLQNMPMVVGPLIRDAFIAPEGFTLMEADFSQLELRVIAWFSGDENMTRAFVNQEDIHASVGEQIFDKPRNEITKAERYKAKLINFGLVYGRTAASLAAQEDFDSTTQEAQEYMDIFFDKYYGITGWIKEQHDLVKERGICTSAFGRIRRFPLILNFNVRAVERRAQNTPIQSTASDVCLIALARVHKALKDWSSEAGQLMGKLLFTVHDSLLVMVREGYEKEAALLLERIMCQEAPLKADFPFSVDVAVGHKWGSQEHIYPHMCSKCEHRYKGDGYEFLWFQTIKECPNCGTRFILGKEGARVPQ